MRHTHTITYVKFFRLNKPGSVFFYIPYVIYACFVLSSAEPYKNYCGNLTLKLIKSATVLQGNGIKLRRLAQFSFCFRTEKWLSLLSAEVFMYLDCFKENLDVFHNLFLLLNARNETTYWVNIYFRCDLSLVLLSLNQFSLFFFFI